MRTHLFSGEYSEYDLDEQKAYAFYAKRALKIYTRNYKEFIEVLRERSAGTGKTASEILRDIDELELFDLMSNHLRHMIRNVDNYKG